MPSPSLSISQGSVSPASFTPLWLASSTPSRIPSSSVSASWGSVHVVFSSSSVSPSPSLSVAPATIENSPCVVPFSGSVRGSIFSTQFTEAGPVTVHEKFPSFSAVSVTATKVPSLPPSRHREMRTPPPIPCVSQVMTLSSPILQRPPCLGAEMTKCPGNRFCPARTGRTLKLPSLG